MTSQTCETLHGNKKNVTYAAVMGKEIPWICSKSKWLFDGWVGYLCESYEMMVLMVSSEAIHAHIKRDKP